MKIFRGLNLLRVFFVAVCMILGWGIATSISHASGVKPGFVGLFAGALLSITLVSAELSITRNYLGVMASVLFGLLGGVILTAMFVNLIFLIPLFQEADKRGRIMIQVSFLIIFSYLMVTLILQSRENFKFIIPFMDLQRKNSSHKPLLVDTSVIIDGRIIDICNTGLIQKELFVPKFVLTELHSLSDSSDDLKRERGRRGLELLDK